MHPVIRFCSLCSNNFLSLACVVIHTSVIGKSLFFAFYLDLEFIRNTLHYKCFTSRETMTSTWINLSQSKKCYIAEWYECCYKPLANFGNIGYRPGKFKSNDVCPPINATIITTSTVLLLFCLYG